MDSNEQAERSDKAFGCIGLGVGALVFLLGCWEVVGWLMRGEATIQQAIRAPSFIVFGILIGLFGLLDRKGKRGIGLVLLYVAVVGALFTGTLIAYLR